MSVFQARCEYKWGSSVHDVTLTIEIDETELASYVMDRYMVEMRKELCDGSVRILNITCHNGTPHHPFWEWD